MLKLLAKKYDYILLATFLYFIINVTIRGRIVDYLFKVGINDYNSKAFYVKYILSDILIVDLVFVSLLSIVLLFSKQRANLNTIILIAVPVFSAVILLYSWLASHAALLS